LPGGTPVADLRVAVGQIKDVIDGLAGRLRIAHAQGFHHVQ
jgi:hypothetical protein